MVHKLNVKVKCVLCPWSGNYNYVLIQQKVSFLTESLGRVKYLKNIVFRWVIYNYLIETGIQGYIQ